MHTPGEASPFIDANKISGVIWDEKLPDHSDDRGNLTELFRVDELEDLIPFAERPEMAYVSHTYPDVVRGPHEHVYQTDMFVFCKSAFRVWLWDNDRGSPTYRHRLVLDTSPVAYSRLIIPPGVVHAYKAVGGEGVVINLPDKLYAGWKREEPVDEIRHEDDPDSPFQIWEK